MCVLFPVTALRVPWPGNCQQCQVTKLSAMFSSDEFYSLGLKWSWIHFEFMVNMNCVC